MTTTKFTCYSNYFLNNQGNYRQNDFEIEEVHNMFQLHQPHLILYIHKCHDLFRFDEDDKLEVEYILGSKEFLLDVAQVLLDGRLGEENSPDLKELLRGVDRKPLDGIQV